MEIKFRYGGGVFLIQEDKEGKIVYYMSIGDNKQPVAGNITLGIFGTYLANNYGPTMEKVDVIANFMPDLKKHQLLYYNIFDEVEIVDGYEVPRGIKEEDLPFIKNFIEDINSKQHEIDVNYYKIKAILDNLNLIKKDINTTDSEKTKIEDILKNTDVDKFLKDAKNFIANYNSKVMPPDKETDDRVSSNEEVGKRKDNENNSQQDNNEKITTETIPQSDSEDTTTQSGDEKDDSKPDARSFFTPLILIILVAFGIAIWVFATYSAVVILYALALERRQEDWQWKRVLLNYVKGPYTIFRFIRDYRYLPI